MRAKLAATPDDSQAVATVAMSQAEAIPRDTSHESGEVAHGYGEGLTNF